MSPRPLHVCFHNPSRSVLSAVDRAEREKTRRLERSLALPAISTVAIARFAGYAWGASRAVAYPERNRVK